METVKKRQCFGGVLIGLVLLLIWSCCEDFSLPLGRMDGFLNGVIKIDARFKANINAKTTAVLSVDAWSALPAFNSTSSGLSIPTDAQYATTTILFDVDNDAAKEEVEVLVVSSSNGSDMLYIFYKWQGDKYTLDENKQYLGWTHNNVVTIAAAVANNNAGTMVCERPVNDSTPYVCNSCDAANTCTPCTEAQSQSDCVPQSNASPSDADADMDIDVDVDMDVDMDIDIDWDLGF